MLEAAQLHRGDLRKRFAKARRLGWEAQSFPAEDMLGATVFPRPKDIFKALEVISPTEVKYLFLGMDPYPDLVEGTNMPYATGIAFDIPDECHLIPPSLEAFIAKIYDGTSPLTPTQKVVLFRNWVENNKALMLNSALTVAPTKSGSHLSHWEPFTIEICANLIEQHPNAKLIALGAHARKVLCKALEKAGVFVSCNHPSIPYVGGERSFAARIVLPK